MSADSFHHQVEHSLTKTGKVYDFYDFVSCVQRSNSGKVTVKTMEVSDFCDWPDCSSTYKLNHTTPRPYLSDIVQIVAKRGVKNLVYKTEFHGPNITLNFLIARTCKVGVQKPNARTEVRGIPRAKKDDIISKLTIQMLWT